MFHGYSFRFCTVIRAELGYSWLHLNMDWQHCVLRGSQIADSLQDTTWNSYLAVAGSHCIWLLKFGRAECLNGHLSPKKTNRKPNQNTVNGGSCCGCSKHGLMGQCRELGMAEVFFFNFFALVPSCPFTLWFQLCHECTQIVLSVSPSRQAWDGCPFLALAVLDQELDFKNLQQHCMNQMLC